ncbi:metal-sensing transcriptional repressor [Roseospirillum parvum]|uniref:DNA-binding transcriptional regulator, FrmR family n=1 Tax=Roseospirillum parvum TaxID=83401 RepID=A0A1G8BLE4_9PROT|nr:metal-sensing transcriptional repressor [Roseospirillum parvum]SDH34001.1 hypothetical protein NreA [Roseospirillum parvum]
MSDPATDNQPATPPDQEAHRHTSHPEVVKRLRRAEGHLRKIASMIEDGRPCVDVAQQLAAVEAAVHNAKQVFIRDHIDHCLDGHLTGGPQGRAVLAEFKDITRYL